MYFLLMMPQKRNGFGFIVLCVVCLIFKNKSYVGKNGLCCSVCTLCYKGFSRVNQDKLSLVGFNNAFNTIRLYKRPDKGLYRQIVLSGNPMTKSAVLFRLLTQTKKAPNKRNKDCQSEQFPYVVQAQYKHGTAADTHLQFTIALCISAKSSVALNSQPR